MKDTLNIDISGKSAKLMLLAISFALIIIYVPVFTNSFVNWDDGDYILENELIRSFNFETIVQSFSGYFHGHYHPFTLLSLAFDYQIGGLNPLPYHIHNLLLHLANTLLVFVFIRKLSKNNLFAVIVSALFGFHPLGVESVAWATERKNLLYATYFLLAAIVYLKYLEKGKSKFFYLSFILFLISLLSKGVGIVLPFVLFAIDFFLGRNIFSRKVIFEKLAFIITAVLMGLYAINANLSLGSPPNPPSVFERYIYTTYAFTAYIFKLILPLEFSALYPYPEKIDGILPLKYYLTIPVFPAYLILVTIAFVKKWKNLFFGLMFFLVNIILLLKFFDIPLGAYVYADRYTYIAGIGLYFLIGLLLLYFLQSEKTKRIFPIVFGIYLIFLGFQTFNRSKVWKDGITLWSDCLEKYSNVPTALNNRASLFAQNGNIDLAKSEYKKAIRYDSLSPKPYTNIGKLFLTEGKYDSSEIYIEKAITNNPFDFEALKTSGQLYFNTKDYLKSIERYSAAIMLKPKDYDLYFFRGNSKADNGDLLHAIDDYSKSIFLKPDFAKAFFIRGMAYIETNNNERGCEDLEKAGELGYDWAFEKIKVYCNDSSSTDEIIPKDTI